MTEQQTESVASEEWKGWWTTDDDGQDATLGEISRRLAEHYQKRAEAEQHIAATLGETEPQALYLIRRIVKFIGPDAALAFLEETGEIEAQGGLMLPDGSRRRTPGGVYFRLVRDQIDRQIAYRIWPPHLHQHSEQHPEQPTQELPELSEIDVQQKEAGDVTVKITVIGRPEPRQIADRGTYVAVLMKSSKVPALPKGLPKTSEEPTKYLLCISTKQWGKVKDALKDLQDVLICEGYPQIDKQGFITVFCSSVVSRNQQRIAKEAQRAKSEA